MLPRPRQREWLTSATAYAAATTAVTSASGRVALCGAHTAVASASEDGEGCDTDAVPPAGEEKAKVGAGHCVEAEGVVAQADAELAAAEAEAAQAEAELRQAEEASRRAEAEAEDAARQAELAWKEAMEKAQRDEVLPPPPPMVNN